MHQQCALLNLKICLNEKHQIYQYENKPGGDAIVTHFVQMESMRFALNIVDSYANRCE